MSGKFALIIGNTEYTDPGLAQLTAPSKDAEDFARILKHTEICAFDDVNLILNQPEYTVRGAIDEFFDQKKPDDLLVLYFSGHGVRDELGSLYLAVKNTIRTRLRSTAIKSDYIREAMDQSRSRRQVLILDCCNSAAFEYGTKGATGASIGTASAFEAGYGRIILTASDSTQFAWEGDRVIGETDNSLFTHYLVEGLEGAADLDSNGYITVDELYDYAYEKVKFATPKQTPSKFSSKQQGEIVLRKMTRIEDIRPLTLSDQLISEIENPYPEVRLRAVEQLAKILNGKNLGLGRSAREALERIETEDDSRTVSRAAAQALEAVRQAEQMELQKAEEERLAAEKAEMKANEERLAIEKAEAEQRAKQETQRLLTEQKLNEERKAQEAKKAVLPQGDEHKPTPLKVGRKGSNLKKERELIVYVIANDSIPLYKSLPASDNWSVLLPKGSKLLVTNTKPEEASESIGKHGHYLEVTDNQDNHGYVAAALVGLKRPTTRRIEKEREIEAIPEEVSSKAEVKKINKEAIVSWIILGTAIAGAVGGAFAWTISGALCGLTVAIALQNGQVISTRQNLLWMVLAWSIGGIIGWQIDFRMPVGGFLTGGLVSWGIGGLITAMILRMEQVLSHELSMIQITVGWAIAGAIGWLLGGSIGNILGGTIGWAIGWGIGGAIGGSVMVWNIKRRT